MFCWYTADHYFFSREECDALVTELHKAASDLKTENQPPDVAGTYWVRVDVPGRCVIESIPLKSETERKELIEEFRQNIPYCKYHRA